MADQLPTQLALTGLAILGAAWLQLTARLTWMTWHEANEQAAICGALVFGMGPLTIAALWPTTLQLLEQLR